MDEEIKNPEAPVEAPVEASTEAQTDTAGE
jgi:hypothetical protein